ncbi:hypothetical protein [Acetobacteroides hydrogenigenes]|uniref:Uncharacterized protein n=1 Tax=Acetobacteroides hydrogenigenes TaxID=979970 RepID=A0A4R2E9T3_9BACT|nr:hypothetical protein [Acetobacteroides hydrogenigenes]TCN64517.1 hypothetical protein CLV25_11342 [Acetobacteroides hydrogenigenes]
MSNRKYRGTAIQMLLALRIILENAISVADKLKQIRPKWDDAYFQGMIATINAILKNDFGYDAATAIKEKTEVVLAKEASAKTLLQQIKMQVELDFRKDKAKCQRYLVSLGLTLVKHISVAGQDQIIEMLTTFRKNLTPEMEKEFVDSGMNPQSIADLKLLADDFYNLNSEQEVLKSNQKVVSAALNDKLNDLYDEGIIIAKLAASMLTDKLDAEKFSFIRALKQVGYKEPPKKEKPTS